MKCIRRVEILVRVNALISSWPLQLLCPWTYMQVVCSTSSLIKILTLILVLCRLQQFLEQKEVSCLLLFHFGFIYNLYQHMLVTFQADSLLTKHCLLLPDCGAFECLSYARGTCWHFFVLKCENTPPL